MFQGSITALITPFRNGGVDEKCFQDFVDWQIKEGTDPLVPVGTTGESPTLSHEEHMRVVELCIEAAGKRVPVIAGTGSNSTDEAISLTRHAKDAAADLTRPMLTRIAIGPQFCQLSGEDGTVVPFLAQGGHGCISVTANVAPRLCSQLHKAWQRRDLDTVNSLNERLMPLHKALFVETSPG